MINKNIGSIFIFQFFTAVIVIASKSELRANKGLTSPLVKQNGGPIVNIVNNGKINNTQINIYLCCYNTNDVNVTVITTDKPETTTIEPETTTVKPKPNPVDCDTNGFTPAEGVIEDSHFPWLVEVLQKDGWNGRGVFLTQKLVMARPYDPYHFHEQLTLKQLSLGHPKFTIYHGEYIIMSNYTYQKKVILPGVSLSRLRSPVDNIKPLCLPDSSNPPVGDYHFVCDAVPGKKIFYKMNLVPFKHCKILLKEMKGNYTDLQEEDIICAEVVGNKEAHCEYHRGCPLIQKDATGRWNFAAMLMFRYGCGDRYYAFLNVLKNIDDIHL